MIGWIKYLWGCDWSKENDIFDSCQVLNQHESEILNDLDQRLSFLSARRFDQASRRKFPNKKGSIKRKPRGPGYGAVYLYDDAINTHKYGHGEMRNKKLINRRNDITQRWQLCSP